MAVLASPLAWPSYLLVLFPAVGWLVRKSLLGAVFLAGVFGAGMVGWVIAGTSVSGLATFATVAILSILGRLSAKLAPDVGLAAPTT